MWTLMHTVNKSSFPRMICKRTRIQHCSSLNLTVLTGSLEHISAFNFLCLYLSLSLSFYFHMPVFESFDWVLETHICSSFLAVQNSSIGDLVTQSLTNWVTFTFAIQRAIPESCYHWDIWSHWWGDMTLSTLNTLSTFSTWWHFFMTIFWWRFFDDNIWWHWDNFWQLERQSWRLDIWDTDYNSDNWEPEFSQSFLPDN